MPDKDMLLLDPATGKPVCRKEVSTLVDQSSIIGNSEAATPFRVNYPVVAAALAGSGVAANAGKLDAALVHASGSASSGAGTTASPLNVPAAPVVPVATDSVQGKVELTGSAQMPAEKTRDDSALTPAGAAKLLKYIKPVASTGALSAEQTSADGIEVPMFSNFSCNAGTRGAPRFTVPVAGGGTCAIDLGNLPYYSVDNPPPGGDSGSIPPGTVVASGVQGCFRLPEKGLYLITWAVDPVESAMYVYNAGYSASHPSPCLGVYSRNEGGCNPTYAVGEASPSQFATYAAYGSITELPAISNWAGKVSTCKSMAITYNGSVLASSNMPINNSSIGNSPISPVNITKV